MRRCVRLLIVGLSLSLGASAQSTPDCGKVPDHAKLQAALKKVVADGAEKNGGLGNQMWATVVNRDGIVCAVAFSGSDRSQQWLESRLISAEKASAANNLSLPNFALSTGNLYYASQPGQSLYGLAMRGPNPAAAFAGPPARFGQIDDPFVGKPIGGVIVFGGGLALYPSKGTIVGGLGVSGDTACADHIIAWKLRHELSLDAVPAGVAPGPSDNMILDIENGVSKSGFGHPACNVGKPAEEIIKKLNDDFPVGQKY